MLTFCSVSGFAADKTAVDQDNPWTVNKLLPSDRLFLDWYVTYFFHSLSNPTLEKIGTGLSDYRPFPSSAALERQRRRYIAALPVKQQARLFLLSSLAIPFDGENAEGHWDYYFNDHKKEIFKLLSPLTEKDVSILCRSMGVDEYRGRYFHHHLQTWMDKKGF